MLSIFSIGKKVGEIECNSYNLYYTPFSFSFVPFFPFVLLLLFFFFTRPREKRTELAKL